MPAVKLLHDRRGYQYISLHHAEARQGSSSRMLYWFRSPPGLKVGREPFDGATRGLLAARYPTLSFDWKRLAELPVPPPEEPWRERRRAERAAKARAAEEDAPSHDTAQREAATAEPVARDAEAGPSDQDAANASADASPGVATTAGDASAEGQKATPVTGQDSPGQPRRRRSRRGRRQQPPRAPGSAPEVER